MTSFFSEDLNELTEYIKSGLSNEKKCLEIIGKAMNEYINYDHLVKNMSDESLNELEDSISRIRFRRNAFTEFIVCSREEANKKQETDSTSKGYFTYGEFGSEYGFFLHKKKLSDQQKEWLEKYPECCYYHGQPCWVWQKEESHLRDEDCECVLGREYSSLILYELNEEEEKRLGVWEYPEPTVQYFDSEPKNLNEIVGGYFTFIKTNEGKIMAVNEEGIYKNLPFNKKASELVGYEVLGNVAIFPEE